MTPWLLSLWLLAPQGVAEPVVDAHMRATVAADVLPRLDVAELRPTIGAVLTIAPSRRITMHADAIVEALVADRGRRATDARARVRDAWVDLQGAAFDVRGGYGRLVWGRLDEISPSDVINPIDVARFLVEGRSEARLAVPFVRARWLPSERLVLEGVVVPRFVRAEFDRLDEDSSPFNLTTGIVVPPGVELLPGRQQVGPAQGWGDLGNMARGMRLRATVGRVDIAASTYRGYDGFGPVRFQPMVPVSQGGAPIGQLQEVHPPFAMYAVDGETVVGDWVLRGETASFSTRTFAARSFPGLVAGTSFDAGVGFDRRVGAVRVFGSVLHHREDSDVDPAIRRREVNMVASVDRAFARERLLARAFAVVNPGDASGFVRGLVRWTVSDRCFVEASVGGWLGTSDDTIGRFRDRDFGLVRVRYDVF